MKKKRYKRVKNASQLYYIAKMRELKIKGLYVKGVINNDG